MQYLLLITLFILCFIIGYYSNNMNNYEYLQVSSSGSRFGANNSRTSGAGSAVKAASGTPAAVDYDVDNDDWAVAVANVLNDATQAGVEIMETKNGKKIFSFRKFFKHLKDQPSDLTKTILTVVVKQVIQHYFPEVANSIETLEQIDDCVEDAIHLFEFIASCEEAFICIEEKGLEEEMAEWVADQAVLAAEEEVDLAIAATGVGVGVAAVGEGIIAVEEVGATAAMVGSIIVTVVGCFGGPAAFGEQLTNMVKALADMDNCALLCKNLFAGKIGAQIDAVETEIADEFNSLVSSIKDHATAVFENIHNYLQQVFDKLPAEDRDHIDTIKHALEPVYHYMFHIAPDYNENVLKNIDGSTIGPLTSSSAQMDFYINCIKLIINTLKTHPKMLKYAVIITEDYAAELGNEWVSAIESELGNAWKDFSTGVSQTVTDVEDSVSHTINSVENDVVSTYHSAKDAGAGVAHWVAGIFD